MFRPYDLILLLSSLVLVPYYLWRGWRQGRGRRGLRERLGLFPAARLAPLQGRRVFWIHAVSVGETRAAIPLLKALRQEYPEVALVLSQVTETGREVARSLPEVDLCLYFPFDLSSVVGRVLDRVRPDLVVIVETEIWPNFVRLSSQRGVPVVMVNGRISDRSFPRYRLLGRWLKPILEAFSLFCMQSEQDAERIRALGAPADRVRVTGNLKFDLPVEDLPAQSRLRQIYRLPADLTVWVAGSTHAGEEARLVEVWRQLWQRRGEPMLVLVPRHPNRAVEVGAMLRERQVPFVLRSQLAQRPEPLRPGEVLLVDTLGEMLALYAAADLVFVGGSLVEVGGHNVLEASVVGRPALFGPHMENFREISRLVREAGAGRAVADDRELLEVLDGLLADDAARREMGERGRELLSQHAGATETTMTRLRVLLAGDHGRV